VFLRKFEAEAGFLGAIDRSSETRKFASVGPLGGGSFQLAIGDATVAGGRVERNCKLRFSNVVFKAERSTPARLTWRMRA